MNKQNKKKTEMNKHDGKTLGWILRILATSST